MSVHFLALRKEDDGSLSTSFGANMIAPPRKGQVAMCGLEGDVRDRTTGKIHAWVDYVLVEGYDGLWYCFTPQGQQCPFPGHPDWRSDVYDESMSLSPFRFPKKWKKELNRIMTWRNN